MDEPTPRPQPPRPVELAVAAAQVREFERQLDAGHQPWRAALGIGCKLHDVPAGMFCWRPPPKAVCAARVHAGMEKRARSMQAKRARRVA